MEASRMRSSGNLAIPRQRTSHQPRDPLATFSYISHSLETGDTLWLNGTKGDRFAGLDIGKEASNQIM